MTASLKRTLSMTILALTLVLAVATSAFAASYGYSFYFNGVYDEHSSGYIYGDAEVNNGEVTITLQGGDYFPDLKVGGVPADRSYSGGLTTFTFPGDESSNIELELHVAAGPHNTWYTLELVWD